MIPSDFLHLSLCPTSLSLKCLSANKHFNMSQYLKGRLPVFIHHEIPFSICNSPSSSLCGTLGNLSPTSDIPFHPYRGPFSRWNRVKWQCMFRSLYISCVSRSWSYLSYGGFEWLEDDAWKCIIFISKLAGVLSNKAKLVLVLSYHMLKSPVKLSPWPSFSSPELPSTT